MPVIPVSFKQTTKDMKLYASVKAHEEQSEFVKKAIAYYLEYLKNNLKER